jgi:hypothetical protein
MKPLSIIPACTVFTPVSLTFCGPYIHISKFPVQSFPHIHCLFFMVASEMMDRGFTVFCVVLTEFS